MNEQELHEQIQMNIQKEFDNHPNKNEIIELIEMQKHLYVFNNNIKSENIKEKAEELFALIDEDIQNHIEKIFKSVFSKLVNKNNKTTN